MKHSTLKSLFDDIANSIRYKTGESSSIVADDFPDKILEIHTSLPTQEKTVVPSTSDVTTSPDEGYALSKVTTKAVSLVGTASNILTGTSVSVQSDGGTITSLAGTMQKQNGGTYAAPATRTKMATGGKYLNTDLYVNGVYLDATASNILYGKQVKACTTDSAGDEEVLATTTGTMTNNGAVTNTITTQGGTYTIPSGYHNGSGKVTASIASGSSTVSASIQLSAPSISVSSSGLITATAALKSQSVTPSVTAGYISSGTAGTVTLTSNSATSQLSTKGATTITPNNSLQTAISSGTYATGNIVVSAVPTETKSITVNGTYTPTSGKYFSQVTVNVQASTGKVYRIGSGEPSSSLGSNGDIYIDLG